MRIAFWTNIFPPRYESFIVNQVRGMDACGHDVTIITHRQGNESHFLSGEEEHQFQKQTVLLPVLPESRAGRMWEVANVLRRAGRSLPSSLKVGLQSNPRLRAGRLGAVIQAEPFLPSQQYDIIHCQYGQLGLHAIHLRQANVLEGRIVIALRGSDLKRLEETPESLETLFAEGDLFLPVTEHFRDRLIELGCPAERTMVHRSGIDSQRIIETAMKRQVHESASPNMVTVGRLVEKKGIEYGLKAFAQIATSDLQLQYKIIGDGPLRLTLQKLAEELGVADRVQFLGWMKHDDVIQHLADATVVVQPSLVATDGSQEGIPNVLKEAMLLKAPVVSTRHAGIPELVEDGITGFLVQERDAAALSDRMHVLLDNPELRKQMGTAGWQHVERYYNSDVLNNHLVELYQELLQHSTSEDICSDVSEFNKESVNQ